MPKRLLKALLGDYSALPGLSEDDKTALRTHGSNEALLTHPELMQDFEECKAIVSCPA